MRMSVEEYRTFLNRSGKELQKLEKQSKYNSKKTWLDGIVFDSQKEANYYSNLQLLMKVGEIKGFCIQPKFILVEGNEEERAITYSADFIIFNNDNTYEIVDVKGFESQQWKRTFKQFKLKYPKLKLKVVK